MKQHQRKHVYINRMRNPESDRAATRRILRELRETTAALEAADCTQVSFPHAVTGFTKGCGSVDEQG